MSELIKVINSVTISGSSNEKKAYEYKHLIRATATFVANSGLNLVGGGGKGVPGKFVEEYRKSGGNHYTCVLPAEKYMLEAGEDLGPVADSIIRIDDDWLVRNVKLVQMSERLIVIGGAEGTFQEVVAALEYKIPIYIFRIKAHAVKLIAQIEGDLYHNGRIKFLDEPNELIELLSNSNT